MDFILVREKCSFVLGYYKYDFFSFTFLPISIIHRFNEQFEKSLKKRTLDEKAIKPINLPNQTLFSAFLTWITNYGRSHLIALSCSEWFQKSS